PVTELPVEEVEPVTELPVEEIAPVAELPVEEIAPVTELPVEEIAPVAELPVEEVAPVAELPVEEVAPIAELPVEEIAEEEIASVEEEVPTPEPLPLTELPIDEIPKGNNGHSHEDLPLADAAIPLPDSPSEEVKIPENLLNDAPLEIPASSEPRSAAPISDLPSLLSGDHGDSTPAIVGIKPDPNHTPLSLIPGNPNGDSTEPSA
ncbi:MAG: hypothetical protein P1U89_27355, partial [Verrucomicrobiales bacterium]|nr:hypothetical protein [Verrucomicrobiales bacterium]